MLVGGCQGVGVHVSDGDGPAGPLKHAHVVEPIADGHYVLTFDLEYGSYVLERRTLVAARGDDLEPVVRPCVAHQVRVTGDQGGLDLGMAPVRMEDELVGVQA